MIYNVDHLKSWFVGNYGLMLVRREQDNGIGACVCTINLRERGVDVNTVAGINERLEYAAAAYAARARQEIPYVLDMSDSQIVEWRTVIESCIISGYNKKENEEREYQ